MLWIIQIVTAGNVNEKWSRSMNYFGLEIELRNKLYREAKSAAIAEFVCNNYPVYWSRLLDRKVDFIAQIGDEYFEIQVVKLKMKSNIFYTPKSSIVEPKKNRWIYLFLFPDTNEIPYFFFIHSVFLSNTNPVFKSIDNKNWCINFSPENIDLLKERCNVQQFWNMCRTKQMFHESKEHNKECI